MWPARLTSCRPPVPADESLGTASSRITPERRVPVLRRTTPAAFRPHPLASGTTLLATSVPRRRTVNKVAATYPGSLGAQAHVRGWPEWRNTGNTVSGKKTIADNTLSDLAPTPVSPFCGSSAKRLLGRKNAGRGKDRLPDLLPVGQTYPQATEPTSPNLIRPVSWDAIGRSRNRLSLQWRLPATPGQAVEAARSCASRDRRRRSRSRPSHGRCRR